MKKKNKTKREIVRSGNRLLKGKDRLFLRIIAFFILSILAVAAVIAVRSLIPQEGEAPEMFVSSLGGEFETEEKYEYYSEDALRSAVSAGIGVKAALDLRPEEISVDEYGAGDFAKVEGVRISGDLVQVTATAPGLPMSDDKYYYLFSHEIYEDSLPENAEPLDKCYKDSEVTMTADLRRGTPETRLFSGFCLAVKQNGLYRVVSKSSYVENPEALASYSYSGIRHSSKKGLLIDPLKTATNEWDDLGVDYATYNFPLAHILGATSNGAYPTISYTYHGKTWYFNGAHIHEYDYLFSTMTRKGIDITGIILNNAPTGAYPELTHPQARSGSTAPYYMFNGSDKAGVEAIGAVATFLAGRYSGGQHGLVHNWIIGNEVNARKEWNYMNSSTSLSDYSKAYAQAYRVFYNAIKSVNAGAGVYICLDQQWDRNRKNNPDYDARDLLDTFAGQIRAGGDIDWGLAYHPYSQPLTKTAFWQPNKLVTNSADTSYITMKNLSVLTSYMHRPELLDKDGSVRSIILSEQGYSSSQGQELQAAAFAYAYKIAAANPDIDYFIYARETDHASEIAEGLALGINAPGGGHKMIYNVYKHIDKEDSAKYTDFALGIIGIGAWP